MRHNREHEADAMLAAADTIKQTGGAVEINGVKIAPCDEYGLTGPERDRHDDDLARCALAHCPYPHDPRTAPPARPVLYVSGPISSDPSRTFEQKKAEFDAAGARLAALGYEPLLPTDLEGECGLTAEECLAKQQHKMVSQGQGKHSWECYLKGDLRAMLQCDGVALLPAWHMSPGARLEVNTAYAVGMDVRPVEGWPLVEPDPSPAVDQHPDDDACARCRRARSEHAPDGARRGCAFAGPGARDVCSGCLRNLVWDGAVWRNDEEGGEGAAWAVACAASADPDPVHVPVGAGDRRG